MYFWIPTLYSNTSHGKIMAYIGLLWEQECGLKNDLYAKNWQQMGVQVEQLGHS